MLMSQAGAPARESLWNAPLRGHEDSGYEGEQQNRPPRQGEYLSKVEYSDACCKQGTAHKGGQTDFGL